MKWSEQMRVLLSEDEHYNQLVYDANENVLYLNNKKLIADLKPNILENGGDSVLCLFYDDAIEIMKKYPFFTDIKFLLNCIFKEGLTGGMRYSRAGAVSYKKYATGTWLLIYTDSYTLGIQIALKDDNIDKPELE